MNLDRAPNVEELVSMPPAQLDEILRATELERRDVDARLALVAAVVEQRRQFLTDGHRSMTGYLKAHLNCSGAEANRIRRRGRLLDTCAVVGEALSARRVSMTNVDVLAKAVAHPRVGHRVEEFVPLLVEHAEHFTPNDFVVLVDRVVANADADGADPTDDHQAAATVTAGPGGVQITVTGGTALQGAEMKAIFDLAVEAEFRKDVEARRAEHGDRADQYPLSRSAKQRRFAAQYAIHMAYASMPPDAQRPEPIVNILFTARRAGRALAGHGLVDGANVFGHAVVDDVHDDPTWDRCETSTGIPVDEHDAVRAMIRGQVRRAVVDAAGVAIDLGARRRLFVGAAREAAQLIALSCSHPGCSIPAEFCQVDHLRRHTDGGLTDQSNAGPGCGSHNRFKERAGLRSRRAANGRVYLIRKDDTVILAAGEREPEWDDADSPASPGSTPGPAGLDTISWDEFLTSCRTRAATTTPPRWSITRLRVADLS